ncbi:MAG: D-alanyl-D-alanine carboxypeptidase/D-alanyl-D-alanine-endopeptidase [Thermoflexibacter sp.]|nr:D-alanyl-D-alanine carboxypeptidase/D-alanyl-D-alanine-endopeptidase [Thermoflexibacter sp.]
MRKKIGQTLCLLIFQLLFFLSAYSQSKTVNDLGAEVKRMMGEKEMKTATFGFCVYDLKADKMLFSYNPNQSMIVASILKLATTSVALQVLGASFHFETHLEYDGKIENGILKGNLYIKGGGDPTLGKDSMDKLMKEWVEIIKKQGIKQIDGAIVGDASIFEEHLAPDNWAWSDIGNYFGAGACGLSINDNFFELYFNSGKNEGDATQFLKYEPKIDELEFVNEVKTGAQGSLDEAYIFAAPYSYAPRYMKGTIPPNRANYIVKAAIPDPPLFCAKMLTKYLKISGIMISKEPITDRLLRLKKSPLNKNRKSFHKHLSAPLKEIVLLTNTKSVNIYAESMLKMIGLHRKNKGTTEAGREAMIEFLEEKKINTNGLFMEDGSGLSHYNALTPEQLTQVLKIAHQSLIFKDFYNSFAIAGKTGTARYLLGGTAAEGNMRAKSGSLTRVRSYAGYVNTKSNHLLAFVIIANNFVGESKDMKKRLEKILGILPEL